jgi:transposase
VDDEKVNVDVVQLEKSIVFGLLERNGRVYTKGVDSVSANELMEHIIKHTKKGSVYFTDTFRSYRSLKRFGKHHTISHGKKFPKTKNHINSIEVFGRLLNMSSMY